MRLSELQYELSPELIAQRPAEPRDASRLLVLHRDSGRIEQRTFRDVGEYLRADDCLVLNNTSVVPARFFCRRATGGRIEALFLCQDQHEMRVLLKPSARLRTGERLKCDLHGWGTASWDLIVGEKHERGEWSAQFDPPDPAGVVLECIGHTPLPPYIRSDTAGRTGQPDEADLESYQTVFAERAGAVAAPTAGLHFTTELLVRLANAGVRQAKVTLHVGLGTFAPIEANDLARHKMHAEWYEILPPTIAALQTARARGGRIAAVGTTSVRVLESLPGLHVGIGSGWTDIFIYPPYEFRHVDALLTNFHLPGSTLLALVMAFATPELIHKAYQLAIQERYRFYSYGDAMLIL
ncbi:MAG: tRNA preQ1(34) S-adenosylmethionine ribosyltransferase-isomerase QueA [Planctomycetota bacterium]